MMTSEYRDQMIPVAAREADCGMDKLSTGRVKSPKPAITKPCNGEISCIKYHFRTHKKYAANTVLKMNTGKKITML